MKAILALFGALVLVSIASAQLENEICTFVNWREFDRRYSDCVDEKPRARTDSQCQEACKTERNCYGYVFVRGGINRCGIYKGRNCGTGMRASRYNIHYKKKLCMKEILRDESARRQGDLRKQNPNFGCPDPKHGVRCSDIPLVEGALHDGTNTEPGAKVTYYCRKGYTLVGNRRIKCLPIGYWEDPPTCVRRSELVVSAEPENQKKSD